MERHSNTCGPFEYAAGVKEYIQQAIISGKCPEVDELKPRLLKVYTDGLPYCAIREAAAEKISMIAKNMEMVDRNTLLNICFLLDVFDMTV